MNNQVSLSGKRKLVGVFALILMLFSIGIIIFSWDYVRDLRTRANLSDDVNVLSNDLLANKSDETGKIIASSKRKEKIKDLAKKDPEKFLLIVVPKNIKKNLPRKAQENIEDKIEITGTIIESVAEADDSTKATSTSYFIQTYDEKGFVTKSFEIYPREGMNLRGGQNVKVEGYSIDNILIPTKLEDITSSVTGQDVLGVSTVGTGKKVAVLMVNFKTDNSDTVGNFTREELAQIYFTGAPATTKYLKNASFGQIAFTGDINDVYGWITIPSFTRAQVCDINETGDGLGFKKAAIDKARVQATSRGINFDDYDFLGFIFPYSTVCAWDSAIASGVGNVDSYAKPHHFLNGDYCAYSSSCSSKDLKFYAALMAHEMGHNLGLSHANGLDCGTKIVDTYANCKSITYADRFDIIGGAWTYLPYSSSANQVIRLGWIPTTNRKTITEANINSTGTYTLNTTSLKQDPGKTQFIRIPRPVNGGAYYLEYRTKNGPDADIPYNLPKGLIIRLSEIPRGVLKDESGSYQNREEQTYLLDLSNSDPAVWTDYLNPSLRDGATFNDSINKIKITQISHSETAGTVNLKIELGPPPCEKMDPSLIPIEPSLTGVAGSTVRYTLTLKNNNSASCADATFNLTSTPPAYWTAVFGRNSVTLSSGTQTTVVLDITSPLTATAAQNPYLTSVTLQDSANAAFSVTKQVSYNIDFSTSVTSTPIPTKSPTPIPTKTPTPTPTPTVPPTKTPTPTPIPTIPPTSTPTPVAGTTILNFSSVKLHGIGTGGDNSNPSSPGNPNPLTTTRTLNIEIFNSTGALVTTSQGNIVFRPATGEFSGNITLPSTVSTGFYTVKVRSDKYLKKQLTGILTITKDATNQAPSVALITGDSNLDNQLTVLDFNILADCYSDLLPPKNCSDPVKKTKADLSDDGKVNQDDYNLFLRELSIKQGD